ncbi:MAG: tRNA pseudouridine(38-40) synthase TruA [Coriobacteriales bacterium]|nr:tRNA pseudouridine(38-40) synthase TruA [Coriobacteriales bacterium]
MLKINFEMMMEHNKQNISLKVAYNGAKFCGFAKQTQQNLPTIEGEIERAFKILYKCDIDITCAGRTDSGVHATDQRISFFVPGNVANEMKTNTKKFLIAINSIIDDDISISRPAFVADDFSARFNVIDRTYKYRITAGLIPPQIMKPYCWWFKNELDIDLMNSACQHIIGIHDFRSFCKSESVKDKNTTREVYSAQFYREQLFGEKIICFEICANAYLHSMIRSLVGTFTKVGNGKISSADFARILNAHERSCAGVTAPAQGLILSEVKYNESDFDYLQVCI